MKIKKPLQALATIATLLISATSLQGQAYGEIHGKVFDENGIPLPTAAVQVIAGENVYGAITDMAGKYKIKPLPPGVYSTKISFITYHTKTVSDIVVSPDKITFLPDMMMTPDTEVIGAAEKIVFRVPLIDVDNTGMKTITAEEVEHMPSVKNLGTFVAATNSEISTNAEGTELYFRGSRAGTSQYFVDGVKIIGRAPRIPQSGVGSISVYTGGVPAKYGDVTGGVIVIETKNYFDAYNKKKNETKK
jgi:hypothetical protein